MDLKGLKTVLTSGFVFLTGLMAAIGLPFAESFVALITQNIDVFLMILGALFAFLRALTTTPIFKS